MIYSSNEDAVTEKYFHFLNEIIGVFLFGFSVTALQFEHPQPFAWFFLLFATIWTFTNSCAKQYRRVISRTNSSYSGIFEFFRRLSKIPVYLIGLISLYFVAVGCITTELIYKYTGY